MPDISKKKVSRKTATKAAATGESVATGSVGVDSKSSAASDTPSPNAPQSKSTSNEPPQTVSPVTNTPKKSSSALAIVALLFSFAALGAAAYTWYDVQVKQVNAASKLVNDVANVGAQITVIGDRVERLQSEQASLITSDQLELRFNQLQAQAQKNLAVLSAEQDKSSERLSALQVQFDDALAQGAKDFLLDDVGQLLKAANVNALVLDNRDGALNALRIAEQQLKELGDPRFTVVRQNILGDIAALEAVASVDLEKLSVAIQDLVGRIDSLDVNNEPPTVGKDLLRTDSGAVSTSEATFSDGLREMGRDFLRLFTIKAQRVDAPPIPLLTPNERYFLDLNLSLALNKAELAALQQRPAIFSQSLAQAQQWVEAYFDISSPAVSAFLQDLSRLQSTDLNVELPPVSAGYAEFVAARGQR